MPPGSRPSARCRSSTSSSARTTRRRRSSSAPSSARCPWTTRAIASGCSTTAGGAWLEALCQRLGSGYLTRPDNAHAKAGNINNGLRHVASLAEPPDFISILDADFVPMPQFLRRALSLFREGDVGIVQTPQHFINPDPLQTNLSMARVWPDEQRYFFDVVMAVEGCVGRRLLLRHLLGHSLPRAAADRRLSDELRDRGLPGHAEDEGGGLPHRLSQRAAVARPRARGPEGIRHAEEPLGAGLCADLPRSARSLAPAQRPDASSTASA